MDTGGDRGERTMEAGSESYLSRRRFLGGSLLSVGTSGLLLRASTKAEFTSSNATSGVVQIDDEPALHYNIRDETKNNNARFEIGYQVEWLADFTRIEIDVENLDDQNIDGESYERFSKEDVLSYRRDGGSDGGAEGDEYRFTFNVYGEDDSESVIHKEVKDEADGTGTGEGDFGNADDPEIEWVIVEDASQNSNGEYTVYYEIEKLDNFSRVDVYFQNLDNENATVSDSNVNAPNGLFTYSEGGTENDDFEIKLEAINESGLVVDTVKITDTADGTDPSWVGNPRLDDSPLVESFTVFDDTENNTTEFTVDYTISNTSRFGGVDVHFDNRQKDSADDTVNSDDQPTGDVSYSQGGTEGHMYHITVEVLETRNGVTFPIQAGTVEDVAGGEDSPTSYPEESI